MTDDRNDKSVNLLDNAIQRTEKRYRGEKPGKGLIGEDIPVEVQEWEDMSEDERADAIRDGRTPPPGARV